MMEVVEKEEEEKKQEEGSEWEGGTDKTKT